MEDVPTRGDLTDFALTAEFFHADDTFGCTKLIELFVILAVLNVRDKLLVALD